MTIQQYLQIQSDVVINIVVWDGNPDTWTPPVGDTMLVQADTPAVIWTPIIVDDKMTDWGLTEILGVGRIGFTWNATTQVLTTNEPKPPVPPEILTEINALIGA